MNETHIDHFSKRLARRGFSRRAVLASSGAGIAASMIGVKGRAYTSRTTATQVGSNGTDPADAIIAIANEIRAANSLRAVIVRA